MSRSAGTTHPQSHQPGSDGPSSLTVGAGLARSTDAEVLAAREHRYRLVRAAVDVIATCGHDPDVAACDDARCHLATLVDGPAICAVAHDLIDLADLAGPATRPAPPSAAEAVAEFRSRLVGAADAIRHCRQAEHGSGACWFTAAPERDGCRAVLRLLHRTG